MTGWRRAKRFVASKHLIEKVTSANGSLVLTFGETRKEGSFYFVNLEDHLRRSQSRFYVMYREVGLSVSSNYLGEQSPRSSMSRIGRC